jgi:hypothetical protein
MDSRRIEVVSGEPFALYRLGFQRLDQSGFSELGYFLWTGGMVVAIFSMSFEGERVQQVE